MGRIRFLQFNKWVEYKLNKVSSHLLPFFSRFLMIFQSSTVPSIQMARIWQKKKKYTIVQLTYNQLLKTTSKNQNPAFEKPAPSTLTFTVYEICCFWNSFCSQCNMERHWWNKVALVSAYIIGSGTTKKIMTKSGKIRALWQWLTFLNVRGWKSGWLYELWK